MSSSRPREDVFPSWSPRLGVGISRTKNSVSADGGQIRILGGSTLSYQVGPMFKVSVFIRTGRGCDTDKEDMEEKVYEAVDLGSLVIEALLTWAPGKSHPQGIQVVTTR